MRIFGVIIVACWYAYIVLFTMLILMVVWDLKRSQRRKAELRLS